MKKRVLFSILILLFLFSSPFILAQNTTTDADQKILKAYDCLKGKVIGKCSSLSIEEKIFSVLAIGECKNELIADSLNAECWPSSKCKIKTTSQAILALDKTSKGTKGAEDWLLSQNTSPPDVEWYLQIESKEKTTCLIKYDGIDHKVVLKDDKTISTSAGSCLTLSSGDWWLKVSPGCYNREFEVSCDKDFQTNLLFKLKTSSILHVSDQVNSRSANGRATETIKSSCFKEDGKCNYEGSLWAASVLDYKGYDISAYMPYLITMAEDNRKYLPESFLYSLTTQDDYRTNLLLRQKAGKYWDETGDKFYDTAVALLPITDEPYEKINSKNWLLEIQDSEGCWQGNIRNTAFILASIWPKQIEPGSRYCTDSGYYCLSEISCKGKILSDYACPGVAKCCDTQKSIESCSTQTGEICSSEEKCVGGTQTSALDINPGETCCVGGRCEVPAPYSECEGNLGTCRVSCSKDETDYLYDCDFPGEVCCMPGKQGTSLWWIWLLLVLIILVALGILFRERLRIFWYRMSSKFKAPPAGPSSGMAQSMMTRRTIPRRIFPPSQSSSRPPVRKSSEIDDVLKKLKEMSK